MSEWTGVAAVAGRRIDAEDAAEARFPSSAVPVVASDIRRLLIRYRVGTVVASAACGADLVALEVAIELGLRLVIVLPFASSRFRATSVVDRGADWGARFDAVLNRTDVAREIIQLAANAGSDDLAYAQATRRIVSEAVERSPHESPLAIAIWEGAARTGTDATKDFLEQATASGMKVRTIISISSARSSAPR